MEIAPLIDVTDLTASILATVTAVLPFALAVMGIGICWGFARKFIKQR